MNNYELFDENDTEKIREWSGIVFKMTQADIDEKRLKSNFAKAIECLKKMNENEYKSDKENALLSVVINTTLKINQHICTDEIIKFIVDLGIHDLFKRMLKFYMSITDSEYEKRRFIMGIILGAIRNINFELVAKENIRTGLMELALKILDSENLVAKEQLTIPNAIYLHDVLFSFLYNNVTESAIKEDLIKLNLIDILMKHRKKLVHAMTGCSDEIRESLEIINVNAISILSNLLDEEQLDKQEISDDIVVSLVKMLNKTIEQSVTNDLKQGTRFYLTYKLNSTVNYVSADNFIDCLLKVSVNDRVKETMFKVNGVEPLIIILRDSLNDYDQLVSAKLLALLCFNENVKKKIKSDASALTLLEKKSKESKNKNIMNLCQQILGMVNNRLEEKLDDETAINKLKISDDKHLMISYCHENKANCVKLNEILKAKGFKTWIDIENPFDNLLDGMASAVNNASIVLVCYSDSYKRSSNCRLEAEFATKKQKQIIAIRVEPKYRPDGWLDFVLGMKFYVDLSNLLDINDKSAQIKQLSDHIRLLLSENTKNMPTFEQHISVDNIEKHDERIRTASNKKDKVKKWTNDEVNGWLSLNGLNDCIPIFVGYDGKALLGLHDLKKNDFSYFRQIVEDEIKTKNINITIPMKLKLFQIIDTLV